MRLRWSLGPALLAIAVAGCQGRDAPPRDGTSPAAVIVSAGELERYVRHETGVAPDAIDDAAREEFREELLAEILFAREAAKLGLVPDPDSLAREVAALSGVGASGSPEELRQEARRHLLSRLYERSVLAQEVTVTPAEVERELAEQEGSSTPTKLAFRQILVDDAKTAQRTYERVTRGREEFETVAREISVAHDRGEIQQLSRDVLPEHAAGTLDALAEGETSKPVEIDGSYYLFRLESRQSRVDPSRAAAAIRRRLEERKFEALRNQRLRELAQAENLPPPAFARAVEESQE